MRLVQYVLRNEPHGMRHLGVRIGEEIVNMQSIRKGVPNTLLEMLTTHKSFLDEVETMKMDSFKERVSINQVDLLPPVSGSDKVICVGMNYKDHCEEQGCPVPEEPIFFSKFSSTLIGPFDSILYPKMTKELDFEVELAFVIGKRGKDIPISSAMDYILGYTTAHDVSARDWQLKKNGGQWLIGKTMDGFNPIGPHIVTKSEIPDPHNLSIKCHVNGKTEQDSNTSQIIHRVDKIVSFLSQFCTLLPGDIVMTGTPPGVGVFRKPPLFLKKGDIVECEIEKIGKIRNEII